MAVHLRSRGVEVVVRGGRLGLRLPLDDARCEGGDRRVLVGDGGRQDNPGDVFDIAGQREHITRGHTELFHRTIFGNRLDRLSRRVGNPFPQPQFEPADGPLRQYRNRRAKFIGTRYSTLWSLRRLRSREFHFEVG